MEPQAPATPPPPAPQRKSKKWPWVAGCGCLTLLCIGIIVAVVFFFRWTNDPAHNKRTSTNFAPYKGSLGDLLLTQLGSDIDVIKFKLVSKEDVTAAWKKSDNAIVEGMSFVYEENAGGGGVKISFKIEGRVGNFSSPDEASAWLEKVATQLGVTTKPKDKGKQFTAKKNDRSIVGWTDGSVGCFAWTTAAKPADDFEKACAF